MELFKEDIQLFSASLWKSSVFTMKLFCAKSYQNALSSQHLLFTPASDIAIKVEDSILISTD